MPFFITYYKDFGFFVKFFSQASDRKFRCFFTLFYAHLSAQVPQSLSGLNAGFEAPLSSVAFIACLIPELQLLNHSHKSVKSNHSAHQCRLFTALNQAGGQSPDAQKTGICQILQECNPVYCSILLPTHHAQRHRAFGK